jgi:pimeloyl-ACP methyl ester carboxylesterase
MMVWFSVALGAVVAAGLAFQWIGTRRDARRLPPPGHLYEVEGLRVHLHALGAGAPPVVFLSGIATSSINWSGAQREIARVTTAVAYDRPGFGWSGPGRAGLTAADHARHLRRVLRQEGLAPPYVLVAHSFGAYIAELFTAAHEAEVAGLVLVDPISWREWIAPDAARRRLLLGGQLFAWTGAVLSALGLVRFAVSRFRRGREGVGRALLGSFGREAVAAVSRVMGEIAKMPPDTWDAIQAHWSRPRAFLAMARHLRSLRASARQVRASTREQVAPWAMPLVVLAGARCPAEWRGAQQETAGRSSRGRFELVEEAGHWVHLDRPEIVHRTILEILRA